MHRQVFIALLTVGVCYTSGKGSAQALQAEPRTAVSSPASSSCMPCNCHELELLGTVAAACAAPAVAALPQMAAACALAATLQGVTQAEAAGIMPVLSTAPSHTNPMIGGTSKDLSSSAAADVGRRQSTAPAVKTVIDEKTISAQAERHSVYHKGRSGRRRTRTNGNVPKRHRRAASSSSCSPTIIASLQSQCAVSGCYYDFDYSDVAMTCDDATAIAFNFANLTACSLLVQACKMEIRLGLPAQPKHPGLLENAALMIGVWQADVFLRLFGGPWSEQQLSTVLQVGRNVLDLDAVDIGITFVSSTTFAKLTSLWGLYLHDNSICSIATGAFSTLTKLEVLDLSYNELEALPSKLFHGLPALKEFYLNYNKLSHLPGDIFQGLPSLTTLDIGYNEITDADASLFEGLSALQTLRLDYNPLGGLQDGLFVLPTQLTSLAELWLESTGISKLHFLPANTTLTYLTVAECDRLTIISVAAGTSIAQADVSGTALHMADLPCKLLGYQSLVARKMQHMTALDLLDKCMGKERLFLDVSDNGERHVEAVRQRLSTDAASFLMGNQSWFFNGQWVRKQAVSLILVGSAVQCSIGMVQQEVETAYVDRREPLQMFSCSCIPGYHEDAGVCYRDTPFAATAGGIVTVVLTTLLATGLLVLCQKRFRKRLHRARHDLEMQRGLLEYAETEVLALKRVWEIGADEVTLVKRIDGDSEGAFGAVWRGDWDGMMVAVKVLRAGLLELDSSFADEFDREADFLMRARHANVVRFFGAGRMPGGEPFVVLELVSRGSLRGLLRGNQGSQLDDALKQRLALDVARGMAYIHSLGALHRDLKSGNVLVTENWRGKVADFGSMRTLLASAAAGSGSGRPDAVFSHPSNARELTLTAGVGTPLYMSLEVLRGDDYGEAADVWAFGVMVWELVEQRSPDLLVEVGEDEGRGPLLGRLLKLLEAGKRLQLQDGAPAWAQRVVAECMLAEPSKRPSFALLKDRLAATAEDAKVTGGNAADAE